MMIATFVFGERPHERFLVERRGDGAVLTHRWARGEKVILEGAECDVLARFADLVVESLGSMDAPCAGCACGTRQDAQTLDTPDVDAPADGYLSYVGGVPTLEDQNPSDDLVGLDFARSAIQADTPRSTKKD